MKKALNLISVLILMWATVGANVQAGNGPGGSAAAGGILLGEPGTIDGTVMEVGVAGQGYLIDTGLELVSLFGIGPVNYWDSLGVALPQVGEEISADVYRVTFSDGTVKAITVSITVGDTLVELRDADTGQPLWRSNGGNDGNGGANAGAGNGLQDGSCRSL